MDGEIVRLEALLHPMATAWPLGADNTTDSLSDDAGSQISVISWADATRLSTRSNRDLRKEVYVNWSNK